MSRRKRVVPEEEGKVDMSPMIDLVFLLLIFFIVNANMITVQMDKTIEVPVADNASTVESADGRIVINISEDGIISDKNGRLLESDEAIETFIKEQKELVESFNQLPSIHLRGDRKSIFKYTKKVVQAGAKAGVNDVRFAAFVNSLGNYTD